MGFFNDAGTIEELDAMLAAVEIKPERKTKKSRFEISRHCMHCGKEVRVPTAEKVNERGEYDGVICKRCYESEIKAHECDSAYADLMNEMNARHRNRMQELRDNGVVVLDDYRKKR